MIQSPRENDAVAKFTEDQLARILHAADATVTSVVHHADDDHLEAAYVLAFALGRLAHGADLQIESVADVVRDAFYVAHTTGAMDEDATATEDEDEDTTPDGRR